MEKAMYNLQDNQTFADIFNYAFADDPDAPKISPGNM
jgi:hypothetical protein